MSAGHKHRHITIAELKGGARGLWVQILADAGIPKSLLTRRGCPCPRCGGKDRFAAFQDVNERGSVHCRHCFNKCTTPKPGDGLSTLQWILGCGLNDAKSWLAEWLYGDCPGTWQRPKTGKAMDSRNAPQLKLESRYATKASLAALQTQYQSQMKPTALARLAAKLGVTLESLERLQVGWDHTKHATTWPMFDAAGDVVGIRMRLWATDHKWSIKGSMASMFVPNGLPAKIDRLFIAEGASDTAAILSLGLDAVGRASASGPVDREIPVIARLAPMECVIVRDNDEPGLRGAQALADAVSKFCRFVRVIAPPERYGDVRDWIRSGATDASLMIAAGFTPPINLINNRKN